MLPSLTAEFYRSQKRRSAATWLEVAREWATIGSDFDAGWRRVGPNIALLVASAQLGSAQDGAAYVAASLASQGTPVQPVGVLDPRGIAGVASDGRPLESLLYGAVVRARSVKADSLVERVNAGRLWLSMAVATQVADAGRDAVKVSVTARHGVSWVRVVSPPCCQRCAVLSGRVYHFSQSFQRHPGCDCSMIPQTVVNPDLVGFTLGPNDVTDLTAKQRDKLAKGANFNRTINDYQRKRGAFSGYLPPTRVDRVIDRAGQRAKAAAALADIGILI
jgi:hypothetical protein